VSEFLRKSTRFVKPEIVGSGDVVEIVAPGRTIPADKSQFKKEAFQIDVRMPDGSVKTWTVNVTTLKRLKEAFGGDSSKWVGRKVRLTVENVVVRGELRRAVFGFPVVSKEEEAKKAMEEFRALYKGDRAEVEAAERFLRAVRGLDVGAEEAAKLAGLKVVEEGGKRYVIFK
jgi:hypothetical protein